MLTNYRSNQITNYFNEGPRFHAKFQFIQDTGEVTGTGGSLLNARDELEDNFVIYYGDILSSINLAEMWGKHLETGSACTVALARDFPVRVGVAELGENDDVRGFVEKPMLHRPVSIGIFCLNKRTLDVTERIVAEKAKRGERPTADLPGEIIPALIEEGEKVKSYITDSFWYDVGSLERYEKLENHVVEKELSFLLH
jgi:NDP-sugar pyrophosphorylase family protein